MQKIINAFKQIGANAVISLLKPGVSPRNERGLQISVRDDRKKHDSCFEIIVRTGTQLDIQDVNAKDRALLLKTRWKDDEGKIVHEEFLCGRDDHGWFVSTLNGHSFRDVRAAVESLRPEEITQELKEKKVRRSKRNKHHNAAFTRQGEWFFIPMPPGFVPAGNIREKERLGTRGKPRIADFVCSYGEPRYTNPNHQNPMTWDEAWEFIKKGETGFARAFIVTMAYAKGRVVHPDHKTVVLDGWHRMVPNTENRLPNSNTFVD